MRWQDLPDYDSEKRHLYYASPEWGCLVCLVIKRSGGICERCHNGKGTRVHHLTYKRLYHESLEDLQHVCDDCNKELHPQHYQAKEGQVMKKCDGDDYKQVWQPAVASKDTPKTITVGEYNDQVVVAILQIVREIPPGKNFCIDDVLRRFREKHRSLWDHSMNVPTKKSNGRCRVIGTANKLFSQLKYTGMLSLAPRGNHRNRRIRNRLTTTKDSALLKNFADSELVDLRRRFHRAETRLRANNPNRKMKQLKLIHDDEFCSHLQKRGFDVTAMTNLVADMERQMPKHQEATAQKCQTPNQPTLFDDPPAPPPVGDNGVLTVGQLMIGMPLEHVGPYLEKLGTPEARKALHCIIERKQKDINDMRQRLGA